jgi:lipopolysaccharide biosynthesis glycosyltransferase
MTQTLNVALSTDNRFAIGCAVSLCSLGSNLSPGARLAAVVAHNGLTPANQAAIREAVGDRGSVNFHLVDRGLLDGLLDSKSVSTLTYARLLLAHMFDPSATRCIYVDSDVVVQGDLKELWDVDLEGRLIGAVPNSDVEDEQRQLARLGITGDRYFNAGVLLVDLAQWRRVDAGTRALAFCREKRPPLWDQDALNFVAANHWLAIPAKWNNWASRGIGADAAVIHYAMQAKPWHADYVGPGREIFFRYLDKTAFGGWRPWNPLGIGAVLRSARRRIPYWPTVVRMLLGRQPSR